MYSYFVTYREEGFSGLISHGISYDQKLAPGASAAQLQRVKSAIEQQSNHNGRRVTVLLALALEEWKAPNDPPGPRGYGREYIIDLGPGHELRVEPAYFDGLAWYGEFSKKRVTPYQWLLKTPIIPLSNAVSLPCGEQD